MYTEMRDKTYYVRESKVKKSIINNISIVYVILRVCVCVYIFKSSYRGEYGMR